MLILKWAFLKRGGNVGQFESTNGTSCDGVVRGGEDPVDHLLGAVLDEVGGGLDVVKVKRGFTGYRTVETGLQIGGPFGAKFVRTSLIGFANPSNT